MQLAKEEESSLQLGSPSIMEEAMATPSHHKREKQEPGFQVQRSRKLGRQASDL